MRFSLSDILAVGIGTAVITTFSYLYYKDVSTKVEASTGEAVGTLTYKRKIAERKFQGQVVWEDIENEVPVYNKDAIRTADQSEAVIHLNDGTEIKLNENSMILLAFAKDRIDIEFSRGSILASRGNASGELKKLNINSGQTKVSIDKSDVKLSQNNAGHLSLLVEKGIAAIDTGKAQEEIGTDKQLVISNNADVITFDLGIKLENPAADRYFLTASGKKQIDFSWVNIEGEHTSFLEISTDNSFGNIIKKSELRGNSSSIELGKGIYYWRVRAVNRVTKKQEISETRRFTILWDEPVFLISPNDNELIAYKTTPPIINFKWTKSEIASGFRLSIGADNAMNNVIKTFEIPNNNLVLDSLIKGTYYWRVEKITGLRDIPEALPSGIFKLNIKEKEIITPPVLIYPKNGKQFSEIFLDKQNITFTWANNPDIREYELFLSKDEDFEEILVAGKTKVNFFTLEKDIPKGKYYWRVSGILDQDESTAPSAERTFSITDTDRVNLILPKNNAVLSPGENEKSASIRFSWERSEIKGRYKLQISKDENFSVIDKESVLPSVTNSATVQDIQAGKYFWKVLLLDDDDSIIVNSGIRSVSVKDMLKAPSVISPKDGYAVNMTNKDSLSLNWDSVKGANLYKLALYRISKGKEYKVADVEQSSTSYRITDLRKLDTGSFYWTLQAFERDDKKDIIRKSSAVKTRFQITLGKSMEKADVSSLKIENL